MSQKAPAKRRRSMQRMRDRGASDVEIAAKFGLTKQRVGQILGAKRALEPADPPLTAEREACAKATSPEPAIYG